MNNIQKKFVLWTAVLIVSPLIIITKISYIFDSDMAFHMFAEGLSIIPGRIGSYIRIGYYWGTMRQFNPYVASIGFGSFFSRRTAEVEKNAAIGGYCIIGNTLIKEKAMVGSGTHIPSGRRQHGTDKIVDKKTEQSINYDQITIGFGTWIGEKCIIMANIGDNCIIGAGSVVTKPLPDGCVAVGNPAKPIRFLKKIFESSESNSIKGFPMKINQLNHLDHNSWTQYAMNHPNSTFYHRVEWKEIIEKTFGHKTFYLIAKRGNAVAGILPIVHIKSIIFGSIFCSMPFLNFGGACTDDSSTEQALFKKAAEMLKQLNGDYFELRNLHKSSIGIPEKTHKISLAIELKKDPSVLWQNFKTKHRTNIRRALKNGFDLRVGGKDLLDDFYHLLSRGWRDMGTPIYQKVFFLNILEAFGSSIQIYNVYYRGKPIATAFNGHFRDTVEGMWQYSLREYSKLQTNYFLYWKMIEHACEMGFKNFHLGRSTNNSGSVFFKKKWNVEVHQLYWEYILNKKESLPELNVDNPKYQKAIALWRKLPVKITQLIGPMLAKNIP